MASQPVLSGQLDIERCPHCSVARPMIHLVWGPFETAAHNGSNRRWWSVYRCQSCGSLILAGSSIGNGQPVTEMYPRPSEVDSNIPETAREYLRQALESLHAPAGAMMLAASAVDAMLKAKGYKEGSLYTRIDKAASDHLITADMASWAHEVRLDANEQRHADENALLPSAPDAKRVCDFARALAEFLFVLPARVNRGRAKS